MNSEFDAWLRSQTEPPPIPQPSQSAEWRYWARRLLVCNPFFLGSAALLLFGVDRLAHDPNFLGAEPSKLLFNFGALQFYEALVVITAVVLARRRIWYDSALLVVVEMGLIFVPFMLIGQGALIHPVMGMVLAGAGLLLAASRMAVLRRGYPNFNLPPRALLLGALFLLLNAALPVLFRARIDDGQEQWATPNLWLWYAVLPILVAGANLLPRPARYGGLNPERHWLPLFIYALWVAGTGTHLWCLTYVSEQPFGWHMLAPSVVAAAWTFWNRLTDCLPERDARLENASWVLTFVSPLVSLGSPLMFELLVTLNAVGFALLFRRYAASRRAWLRELLIASVAMLVLGVPEAWARELFPDFIRLHAGMLALAIYVTVQACRSRRLTFGIAGAFATSGCVSLAWPGAASHAAVEAAAVFLLAHSLGWRRDDASATFVRTVAGMIWIADALVWIHAAGWKIDLAVSLAAVALGTAWWIVSRVTGRRDWIVFVSALAALFIAPGDWLLRRGSPGLLALAASFATFAVGVGVAWTRHAWDRIHGVNR